MARACFGVKVNGTANGNVSVSASFADDPYTGAAETTVAANIATLVADGATPTQAHVTTLNTNWATLIAGPALSDVVLSVNLANVTSKNQLVAALNALLAEARKTSLLT